MLIPPKRLFATSLLVVCIWQGAQASEQLGPVYPIKEPDMLEEIQKTLLAKQKSGELAKLEKEAIERSKRSIERPKQVSGLQLAKTNRTFYYDPTVTVTRRITDPQGRVIANAGDKFNPLDQVSLPQNMLFVNGDDKRQVSLAEKLTVHYKGMLKVILVNGEPLKLSKRWDRQVYFDQGGTLVRKLGISAIPSLVSQEGKRLRIDEIELK